MSNQPTTSYKKAQPVLPDLDENHQIGNQPIEELSTSESPLPHSSLLSTETQSYLKSQSPFSAHQYSLIFSPSTWTIIPSFPILNPKPTITLSKQQLSSSFSITAYSTESHCPIIFHTIY